MQTPFPDYYATGLAMAPGYVKDGLEAAVEAGADSRRTMQALHVQVGLIGTVADMIGEIAANTNLPARASQWARRPGLRRKPVQHYLSLGPVLEFQ